MADGDGGAGGSDWNRGRGRADYGGGIHYPSPVATALPGPYPTLNFMGDPSPQGQDSTENIQPYPVLWHSVPANTSSSPSSDFPVSFSPSDYHTATTVQAPFTPSSTQSSPMGFPFFVKPEIMSGPLGPETLQSSALPVVISAPPYASHGINEPGLSAITTFTSDSSGYLTLAAVPLQSQMLGAPTPSPSTIQRDINALDPILQNRVVSNSDQAENSAFPIGSSTSPSANLLSSNPSIGFAEPPPVPDSFPRDPVPQAGRGEGWPYAPQGWPKADDKWGWRVGKRAAANFLWIDRYIMLPKSLSNGRRAAEFASKKSLAEYLGKVFPLMDTSSIFQAFDWKIPAPKDFEVSDKRGSAAKRDKPSATEGDNNSQKLKRQCRAGNPDCFPLNAQGSVGESLGSLVCNICCSEPSFCRECKCILCCRFFLPDADEFSIIRCINFPVPREGVCGHAVHLECALNSQLAGVIKKSRLDMEYVCRRCDGKTDLRETVKRLYEVMGKPATQSKVESCLQLALRIVQDPEDEARSPGKTQSTFIGAALKKVQAGADIVESYKELNEQLLGLQAERSRAMGRKRTVRDSLHPSEASLENRIPPSRSVGSPDDRATPSTFMFQENSQGTPAVSTRQGGLNDTSPAVQNNVLIVCQGGSEADGVSITSNSRRLAVLSMDKELPSISFQNSPKSANQDLSNTTSLSPHEFLSCTPLLSSLLDQSVCKPPTLSIEEHIRQCEAMTDRVKGAGQLSIPPGTLEVVLSSDVEPASLTRVSSTDKSREDQVVNQLAEASHGTCQLSCARELITLIPSSSRAKSPTLCNSQDAGEVDDANTKIIVVSKSPRIVSPTVSKSGAKRPSFSNSQDAGGHDVASSRIIEVPRIEPPIVPCFDPALEATHATGGHDIAITQVVEVPTIETPTVFNFEAVLETTHAAGLEAEYEDQIRVALEKLKRAQAAEYVIAEESLNAQKKIVIDQYRQIENVCGQFSKKENLQLFPHQIKKNKKDEQRTEFDLAMNRLMAQYGKAQEGQKFFESMLVISRGFGQVSKELLREFFNWPPSDTAEV